MTPRVAVAIVVRDHLGRLLLLRRGPAGRWPGSWCFPGGGVEPGERAQVACARELLEETGLAVSSFVFEGFTEVIDEEGHLVGLVFTAAGSFRGISFDDAANCEPEKHDDIGWFDEGSMPSPLMPGVAFWLEWRGGRA